MTAAERPTFLSCALAFLFASLAPAVAAAGLSQSWKIGVWAFLIALTHAGLLGIPAFVYFHSKGRFGLWWGTGAGFLIGTIPTLLFGWPMSFDGTGNSSINNVPMKIDGMPTATGWLSYLETVISAGLFGMLGGFVFWLTLTVIAHLRPSAQLR